MAPVIFSVLGSGTEQNILYSVHPARYDPGWSVPSKANIERPDAVQQRQWTRAMLRRETCVPCSTIAFG